MGISEYIYGIMDVFFYVLDYSSVFFDFVIILRIYDFFLLFKKKFQQFKKNSISMNSFSTLYSFLWCSGGFSLLTLMLLSQ